MLTAQLVASVKEIQQLEKQKDRLDIRYKKLVNLFCYSMNRMNILCLLAGKMLLNIYLENGKPQKLALIKELCCNCTCCGLAL